MKTPIATIIGATDTLQENETALSSESKSTLLAEIVKAGDRLNQQVQNLLNMSRLESGMLKIKKDWCDVNELIHMVIQKFDPMARSRIHFEAVLNLPLFKLDAGLIEQVIFNIVHNAMQYTPVDTTITLRALHHDEDCVIEIADHGPGFPESQLNHIFDPFFRLPETTSGGTGLGLSIAKGFTEAHGGTLSVKNMATDGVQFTILIPTETSFLNSIKHE